jgi:hypothetical protein
MEMSHAEIERYAPYHTFPEFPELRDVPGQAYDRGAECAMRRLRKA